MKKRNYFLTMVLAALAGISICSCNDDDDNGGNGGDNASNSFIMKFTGLVTDSLSYAEDSTLKAAYVNAFEVSDFRSSFSIKGKDSIEISEKIMEKCSLAEASLEGRDFINAHTISIYKTNNDDEGEKKSTYYVWYNKEYYSSTDQFFSYNNAKPFYNAGGYNYATEIKIQQEYFNDNGDKRWRVPDVDLNDGAGGEYTYMGIYFKDYNKDDVKDYITDVICVSSGSGLDENFTLKYNGRTYKMAKKHNKDSQDMNHKAGGPYLYIMYTRDYYDGRYLVNCSSDFYYNRDLLINPFTYTGSAAETSGCTRLVYTFSIVSESFSEKDLNLMDNERVVPMVDVNGNKLSNIADFNSGAGGEFISMICAYDIIYKVTDYENWMHYVDGKTPICRMSIPGSHDTFTYGGSYALGYGQAQIADLGEQWECGVRYFDMRSDIASVLTHGSLRLPFNVNTGFLMIRKLLEVHKDEFAIVVVKYEKWNLVEIPEVNLWKKAVRLLIHASIPDTMLVRFRPDLTLDEVRGKILVIFRNKLDDYEGGKICEPYGCVADDWTGGVSTNIHFYGYDPENPATVYIEDDYHPDNESVDNKVNNFKKVEEEFHKTLSDENSHVWCIAHTSSYAEGALINNAIMAESVNPKVCDYIKQNSGTPLGIVVCDFAGVNWCKQYTFGKHYKVLGRKLTDHVVQNNFVGK